ncbi:hypothetical protein [uncultured Alsobacter sp.]|uniref:hypothetical protein n=1 Tax=uncultured Alsobacter sp. TaxID=1748258 RepID=UPI0025E39D7B|nr:hypothetical protein [uncultured Alsobacter sp.]
MRIDERVMARKWCPFARIIPDNAPGKAAVNRDIDGTAAAGTKCLTTECAAWQRLSVARGMEYAQGTASAEPERPSRVAQNWIWVPPSDGGYGVRGVWMEPEEEFKNRHEGRCRLMSDAKE